MSIDIKWLDNHVLMRNLSANDMLVLNSLEELHFNAGDTILGLGEIGGGLFILRKGSIKVIVKREGKQVRLIEDGEGAMFSKMCLLEPNAKSMAQVTATSSCTVYKLPRALFLDILHTNNDLAFLIVTSVMRFQEHPDNPEGR